MTCGQRCASCVCVKSSGHLDDDEDPIHACNPSCGGAWTGTEGTDDWRVVSFPNPTNQQLAEYEARLLEEFDTHLNRLDGRKEQ